MTNYPYFIYPMVMELRGNAELDEKGKARLRRIVAANVGDIPSLRLMLGLDPEEFAKFYPDMVAPSLSTSSAIDSFLANYGDPYAPTPKAAAEIPVETAAYVLEDNADDAVVPQDETSSAIDSFLAAVTVPKTVAPKIADEGKENKNVASASMESANLCIKKHDYKGALEIIQSLILNNPEKSVYFADQIRFLKKLMYLQARNNN